jgi:hypothetical protein
MDGFAATFIYKKAVGFYFRKRPVMFNKDSGFYFRKRPVPFNKVKES